MRRSSANRLGPARWLAVALAIIASLVLAVAALGAEGELSFVECLEDTGSPSSCSDEGSTVNGLDVARAISASPDGKHLYVASSGDDAVAAFSRNPITGAVGFVEAEVDGVGGVEGLDFARGVTVSPDGKHVYVVSRDDDALAVFSRDPSSGALSFVECLVDDTGPVGCSTTADGLDFARGVNVSPDGKHVYVTSGLSDDELAAFARDQDTGELSFVETEDEGVRGAGAVTTSPDGRHVYVASEDEAGGAVAAFSRNQATGALGFVECVGDTGGPPGCDTEGGTVNGLDGASGVTTSPDGKHVYVAGSGDNAVAVLSRNGTTGGLNFVDFEADGVGGVDGLDGAFGVTTSPDGKHVYVASAGDDSLAAFFRNPATGSLTFVEFEDDGVGGVDGLDGARGVSVSPDGGHVYVAASVDGSIAAFDREADTTPPQTMIDSGPTGSTRDTTPTFTFSSSDPAFTSGFGCRIDGGAFSLCSSPTTIGPLAPGPHSFEVRATDTAANRDATPARRNLTVLGPADPRPPKEGKRATLVPKRGRVLVNPPGPGGFRRLVEGETLAIGTKVDARKGRVVLITDYNGRLQRMLFYDGRFKIGQKRGRRPIVQVKLIGKLDCSNRRVAADGGRTVDAAERKRRGKGRRLWGKGKKGKYKSKGKRGSATVRGTKWLTNDRCDGSTRFTLKRGKLQIDDFGKRGKRNAVLKGKGQYTAKA